jgi:regulatory protein
LAKQARNIARASGNRKRSTALTRAPAKPHDEAMAATVYERVMERAFRLISFKPRSVAELRERLLEKDWADETAVEQVIARLRELNYLDDDQLATNFAHSRLTIKPLGRVRLRRDLQRRKLAAQTVETALDEAYTEHSEEELIERAINKRLRLKGAPKSPEETKKLFDYLLRRGFNYDLVMRKVRSLNHSAVDKGEETE